MTKNTEKTLYIGGHKHQAVLAEDASLCPTCINGSPWDCYWSHVTENTINSRCFNCPAFHIEYPEEAR